MLEKALKDSATADIRFVLMHHPMSWILDRDSERGAIALGKTPSVILCGHMHKTKASVDSINAQKALFLQAGCAFQARDSEKWVHGILLGELDIEKSSVLIRPVYWNNVHGEWKINEEAFQNRFKSKHEGWWRLPIGETKGGSLDSPKVRSKYDLAGWAEINAKFISDHKGSEESAKLVKYFDGRDPDWSTILSDRIPEREIVGSTTSSILEKLSAEGKPLLVTLLGASGEGKSTAFLQCVRKLYESGTCRVLWRVNDTHSISAQEIRKLPRSDVPYLLCADNSANLLSELNSCLSYLDTMSRTDINFFFADRTVDWREAQARHKLDVSKIEHEQIRLGGLSAQDAERIVNAWASFSEDGLGKSYGKTTSNIAGELVAAASNDETEGGENSLYGAMLEVRFGDDLAEHLKRLIQWKPTGCVWINSVSSRGGF